MRRFARVSAIGILLAILASTTTVIGQDGRIRTGRMIYEEHCFRCHGLRGEGDGPDSERLIVKPANFHAPGIRAKSDFDLWMSAAYGVAYTPMHGWLTRLTEEEILEALSYIRELAPSK